MSKSEQELKDELLKLLEVIESHKLSADDDKLSQIIEGVRHNLANKKGSDYEQIKIYLKKLLKSVDSLEIDEIIKVVKKFRADSQSMLSIGMNQKADRIMNALLELEPMERLYAFTGLFGNAVQEAIASHRHLGKRGDVYKNEERSLDEQRAANSYQQLSENIASRYMELATSVIDEILLYDDKDPFAIKAETNLNSIQEAVAAKDFYQSTIEHRTLIAENIIKECRALIKDIQTFNSNDQSASYLGQPSPNERTLHFLGKIKQSLEVRRDEFRKLLLKKCKDIATDILKYDANNPVSANPKLQFIEPTNLDVLVDAQSALISEQKRIADNLTDECNEVVADINTVREKANSFFAIGMNKKANNIENALKEIPLESRIDAFSNLKVQEALAAQRHLGKRGNIYKTKTGSIDYKRAARSFLEVKQAIDKLNEESLSSSEPIHRSK